MPPKEFGMKKVFLNEFSAHELQELLAQPEKITAICTFGSCENHGWHCCLGPDTFVPTEVAKRAAERVGNTLVVPCVPFGTSINYNKFPMAVTLRYETVIAIAEDIFESLISYGIKHIYILNGHDGNIAPLGIAAAKVKDRHADAKFLYLPAWWEKVGPLMGSRFEVWNGLGHGGEGETSLMMALRPDLVDLSKAVAQMPDNITRIGEKANVVWDIKEISETGATGDPTKATAEKGRQMLDILVDLVASAIEDMNRIGWNYSK